MKTRWLSTLLTLLLLSGCALPEPVSPQPPPQEEPVQTGEAQTPGWQYRYWLGCARRELETACAAEGEAVDWSAPVQGGGTLAQLAEQQARENTALYATVEAWAAEQNCLLTEADRQSLDRLWQQRAADAGGEEAYHRRLAEQGLTPEQARLLAETGQKYARLHALALEPDSGFGPTPEELRAFAEEAGYLTVDRYLAADADREKARKRAADAFSRLNAADDPAAFFPGLAAEGDDPGPRTFRRGEGVLSPQLEESAAFLREGQCSGILEAEDGFSILLRLPPARETLVPLWLDQALQKAASQAAAETSETAVHAGKWKFNETKQDETTEISR